MKRGREEHLTDPASKRARLEVAESPSLVYDMLVEILQYTSRTSIFVMAHVCKQWREFFKPRIDRTTSAYDDFRTQDRAFPLELFRWLEWRFMGIYDLFHWKLIMPETFQWAIFTTARHEYSRVVAAFKHLSTKRATLLKFSALAPTLEHLYSTKHMIPPLSVDECKELLAITTEPVSERFLPHTIRHCIFAIRGGNLPLFIYHFGRQDDPHKQHSKTGLVRLLQEALDEDTPAETAIEALLPYLKGSRPLSQIDIQETEKKNSPSVLKLLLLDADPMHPARIQHLLEHGFSTLPHFELTWDEGMSFCHQYKLPYSKANTLLNYIHVTTPPSSQMDSIWEHRRACASFRRVFLPTRNYEKCVLYVDVSSVEKFKDLFLHLFPPLSVFHWLAHTTNADSQFFFEELAMLHMLQQRGLLIDDFLEEDILAVETDETFRMCEIRMYVALIMDDPVKLAAYLTHLHATPRDECTLKLLLGSIRKIPELMEKFKKTVFAAGCDHFVFPT